MCGSFGKVCAVDLIEDAIDKFNDFGVDLIDLISFKGFIWVGDLLDKVVPVWVWYTCHIFDDSLAFGVIWAEAFNFFEGSEDVAAEEAEAMMDFSGVVEVVLDDGRHSCWIIFFFGALVSLGFASELS